MKALLCSLCIFLFIGQALSQFAFSSWNCASGGGIVNFNFGTQNIADYFGSTQANNAGWTYRGHNGATWTVENSGGDYYLRNNNDNYDDSQMRTPDSLGQNLLLRTSNLPNPPNGQGVRVDARISSGPQCCSDPSGLPDDAFGLVLGYDTAVKTSYYVCYLTKNIVPNECGSAPGLLSGTDWSVFLLRVTADETQCSNGLFTNRASGTFAVGYDTPFYMSIAQADGATKCVVSLDDQIRADDGDLILDLPFDNAPYTTPTYGFYTADMENARLYSGNHRICQGPGISTTAPQVTTVEATTAQQTTVQATTVQQTTRESTTARHTTREQTTAWQTTRGQTTAIQTTVQQTTAEQTTLNVPQQTTAQNTQVTTQGSIVLPATTAEIVMQTTGLPPASSEQGQITSSSAGSSPAGLIAGILVGVLCALAIAFLIFFFLYRRRKQQRSNSSQNKEDVALAPVGNKPRPKSNRSSTDLLRAVPISELGLHISKLNQNAKGSQNTRFFAEFNAIEEGCLGTAFNEDYSSAQYESSQSKNRYENVLPPENTRVKLTPLPGVPESDYINANWINGLVPKSEKKYIAAQGPLPTTVEDFWRMIWETNSSVILMLTRLIENNKVKCEQYWPEGNNVLKAATLEVRVHESTVKASGHIVQRSFKIRDTKSGQQRVISHFQYLTWPDHGIPRPGPFVRLVELVDQHNTTNGPITVHCSAGIGRTGTFIAVHALLAQVRHEKSISSEEPRVRIPQTIINLRKQRPGMVQTEDQYLFIWVAVKFGLEKPKEPDYSAFKDVALSFDQNPRYRPTMEDEHIVIDQYGDVDHQAYFGLYDGHGGKGVATYVGEHLHMQLAMTMPNSKTMKDAFIETYKLVNQSVQSTPTFNKQGCTSVSVFLSKQGNSRILDVANAGDANAILCRGKEALILTKEHKGNSQTETERVQKRGGWVVNGKVAGVLSVTRAFGDVELKDFIDAEPHVTSVTLTSQDTHLIIACDGLWDVMTPQEAVTMIFDNKNSSAEELSFKLVQEALKKGTRDNISVMIVVL